MHRLNELREQRARAVTEMRGILAAAEKEKRALTNEEDAKYGTLNNEQLRLKTDIEREERQIELEREMAANAGGATRPDSRAEQPPVSEIRVPEATCRGLVHFFAQVRERLGMPEARATLQSGSFEGGGALVPMEQLVDQLIKNVDDEVFIRRKATKFRVPTAETLGVPTLETDPNDADWTTELATGSEDTATAFGKRQLHPHPFAKRLKISKDLLRRLPTIETFLRSRLAYKFAITEEKGFLTGNGVGQPLGVFTASADGVPTTRDVSDGNTTTEIRFDGLINAKFSVKGAYWPRCEWVFHRDAVKQLTKLKDGEGQYLWRQSVRDGEPDMLLGRPLTISEYAPNTFTTGLYVGLFGDFSHYWIADALDVEMQLLTELYAETNQVGIIGRAKADGMPTLAEAFARVKLA